MPALRPDVGIVHAQQADRRGQRAALGDQRRAEGDRARVGRGRWSRSRRSSTSSSRGPARSCSRAGRSTPSRSSRTGRTPRTRSATTTATTRSTCGGTAISRDRERFTEWMRQHVLETTDIAEYRARLAETVGVGVSATYTADEMMAVAASRRLRDGMIVLRRHRPPEHGGEPRPRGRTRRTACSSTRAGRSAPSRPPAALDRRRRARRDRRRRRLRSGDLQLLAPGRPHRRRLPRRRADRPVRQPEQHGDRRLRLAAGAPPRRRRGARDRRVVPARRSSCCGSRRARSWRGSTSGRRSASATARAAARRLGFARRGRDGRRSPTSACSSPTRTRCELTLVGPAPRRLGRRGPRSRPGWELRVADDVVAGDPPTPDGARRAALAARRSTRMWRHDGHGAGWRAIADEARPGGDPPYVYPDYRSTALRAPTEPLLILPHTLSETTGPAFGDGRGRGARPRPDAPARRRAAGRADRRHRPRHWTTDGRPIRSTLVEVWQANAAGRYAHRGRPAPGPARPELHRRGPLPDRRRRPLPLRDDQAGRLSRGATTRTRGGRRTSTSRCSAARSPTGSSPRCTSRATRCFDARPDLPARCRDPSGAAAPGRQRVRLGDDDARVGARLPLRHRARRRAATPLEDR